MKEETKKAEKERRHSEKLSLEVQRDKARMTALEKKTRDLEIRQLRAAHLKQQQEEAVRVSNLARDTRRIEMEAKELARKATDPFEVRYTKLQDTGLAKLEELKRLPVYKSVDSKILQPLTKVGTVVKHHMSTALAPIHHKLQASQASKSLVSVVHRVQYFLNENIMASIAMVGLIRTLLPLQFYISQTRRLQNVIRVLIAA